MHYIVWTLVFGSILGVVIIRYRMHRTVVKDQFRSGEMTATCLLDVIERVHNANVDFLRNGRPITFKYSIRKKRKDNQVTHLNWADITIFSDRIEIIVKDNLRKKDAFDDGLREGFPGHGKFRLTMSAKFFHSDEQPRFFDSEFVNEPVTLTC